MKIKRVIPKEITIEGFAKKHNLCMEIHRRPDYIVNELRVEKYYAQFSDNPEIKDGPILIGAYGNGKTEKEAINNYAREISEKLLVFHPFDDKKRCEIDVPHLKVNDEI